jgi:arabinose-5-phosphate isomerase
MKSGPDLPWAVEDASMDVVVNTSTEKVLGAVLVKDKKGGFIGLITDGDIRRALKQKKRFFELTAADIMTKKPICVAPDDKAIQALELMQNRPSQINVLPVVEGSECVGLVRLHDLIGQL